MDDTLRSIPETGLEVGITTTGRISNRPHRREVRLYDLDGRFFITGSPGRRDWYANLLASPDFTVHLKERTQADLPATATPIRQVSRRRAVLSVIHQRRGGSLGPFDAMLERSPLVEVHFDG